MRGSSYKVGPWLRDCPFVRKKYNFPWKVDVRVPSYAQAHDEDYKNQSADTKEFEVDHTGSIKTDPRDFSGKKRGGESKSHRTFPRTPGTSARHAVSGYGLRKRHFQTVPDRPPERCHE